MRVNCNISGLIANNQLGKAENTLSQSIERLSSGLRINKASDDSSGMAVAKKMHTQLKALERAKSNTTDGISVVQTAEATLGEMENILQRMRELSVQAANGTNSNEDRQALQKEMEQLQKEVDRISTDTEYNTMPLIDGTLRRRAFPNADEVEMMDMSSSVKAGEYTFSVTAEATCATMDIDISAMVGTAGSVTVDGAIVAISEDDDIDAIYNKFMDVANLAGLDIEDNGGSISLTERTSGLATIINVGLSDSFSGVSVSGANVTQDPETKLYTATGEDAKGTLTTSDEGFSATATWRADGNRITVRDVNDFEMVFEVPNDATLTDVTFKVTDIGTMGIQVGAAEGQQIEIDIPKVNAHTLGIEHINIGTELTAGRSIAALDKAIEKVSLVRSKLGAYQNRLETTEKTTGNYHENLTRALSGIEDCDMAEEMTTFTSMNVRTQAATSVLAQANERPQTVLQLLQ